MVPRSGRAKGVDILVINKTYPDSKCQGKHFGTCHFKLIVTKDTDCYWINEEGENQLLFKFRKNAIKLSKVKLEEVREIYEKYGKKGILHKGKLQNKNEFMNSSNLSPTRNERSKISGFYDRTSRRLSSEFKTQNVCRTTAFTRDNFEKWEQVLPFFEKISLLYKRLAPKEFKRQIDLFKKCPPNMQVGKTPFTTITSNYNWRTACDKVAAAERCHKDKGDYEEGLGNLTILGDDTFKGGYLGFPQFKVAIDVKPLDFVIMDVHQWHCNTQLKANDNNVRLSFVCYFRKNMIYCNGKKVIKGETFYYKK